MTTSTAQFGCPACGEMTSQPVAADGRTVAQGLATHTSRYDGAVGRFENPPHGDVRRQTL
ncbi:hypothetical protein [Streptomyces sioyaensis]|uniref:hypothetical protein n=1 Tax=Streptomyces sioyaensis TaxID=67364 RepID=UPI0036E5E008